jgi:hypothetical protein
LQAHVQTAAGVLSKISSQTAQAVDFKNNKSSMSQTKSDEANLNEKSSGPGSSGSSGSKQNVHIKQCKLRRTRFVNKNYMASKSSIGGGIKFRESHIPR